MADSISIHDVSSVEIITYEDAINDHSWTVMTFNKKDRRGKVSTVSLSLHHAEGGLNSRSIINGGKYVRLGQDTGPQ